MGHATRKPSSRADTPQRAAWVSPKLACLKAEHAEAAAGTNGEVANMS
jgi:hypothetical protein